MLQHHFRYRTYLKLHFLLECIDFAEAMDSFLNDLFECNGRRPRHDTCLADVRREQIDWREQLSLMLTARKSR